MSAHPGFPPFIFLRRWWSRILPRRSGWITRLERMLFAVVIAATLLSCRFLVPSTQVSPSNKTVPASQIQLPQKALPADLDQIESQVWMALRTPLRAELADQAEDLYSQADTVRSELLARVVKDLIGSKPRYGSQLIKAALAQFKAVRYVLVTLTYAATTFASHDDGTETKTETYQQGAAKGNLQITLTKSGTTIVADVQMTIDITAQDGAVLHETARGVLEIQVCPDPQGRVPAKISLTLSTSGSAAGKSIAMQFDLNGHADILVNDNADIDGYALDFNSSFGVQTQSGSATTGEFAEVHTDITFQNIGGPGGAQVSGSGSQVTRSSSNASAATYETAAKMGRDLAMFFVIILGDEAKKLWQNGYCVEIVTENAQDYNTVERSSTNPFTAKVRHKFDGNELNVPITVIFSGEKEFKPLEKSQAPVNYTYTAPGEEKKLATIKMETRSKRGVAKRDIQFYTGPSGWKIDQDVPVQGGALTFKGLSCEGVDGYWNITYTADFSAQGFTINGTLEGLFQPDGKASLSHTVKIIYPGVDAGANASGESDAVLVPDGENYIIGLDGGTLGGTVWAPESSRSFNADPKYNIVLNVTEADSGQCPGK